MNPFRAFAGVVERLEGRAPPVRLTLFLFCVFVFALGLVRLAVYMDRLPAKPEGPCFDAFDYRKMENKAVRCEHSQHRMVVRDAPGLVGVSIVRCVCPRAEAEALDAGVRP